MYLWAFPIQQAIIVLWGPLPLGWNIVVVLALSAAASLLAGLVSLLGVLLLV